MKISTKCDYAVRALLDLAIKNGQGSTNIHAIATRQNIPKRYLEHLLLVLKNCGLVNSLRGKKGGYQLSRPANKITVGDIMTAIEGSISILPKSNSNKKNVVSNVWISVQDAMVAVLESITLEKLVTKKCKAEKTLTYYI